MVLITIVIGAYKPTYNVWGPHIVEVQSQSLRHRWIERGGICWSQDSEAVIPQQPLGRNHPDTMTPGLVNIHS